MIRDTYSKALVETDITELQKYRKEKARDTELRHMKREIEFMKSCINRIDETIKKIEGRS